MKKKTRLLILLFCVASFFAIAPVLVAYSMGYRFDWESHKIMATGGIFVRTFPEADNITIDSKISQKPGFLANSVFVQSLLPKQHVVLVQKNGYFDYQKTLPVRENQVTKIENVLLVKKDIKSTLFFQFEPAKNSAISEIKWTNDHKLALIKITSGAAEAYYIFDAQNKKMAAAKLAYLDKNCQQITFNPNNPDEIFYLKNNVLYSGKTAKPAEIIRNVLSYSISGDSFFWISAEGGFYKSDLSGKNIEEINLLPDALIPRKQAQIQTASGGIFIVSNNNLVLLPYAPGPITTISKDAESMRLSPDGKNLAFYTSGKISVFNIEKGENGVLYSHNKGNIKDISWVNNDYIVFADGDKILISEIDYRGNVNMVTLPQQTGLQQISYNHADNKIYGLLNNAILSSDKITP